MNPKKGKLIALEGIDGSGKATQTRLLLERLMSENIPVTKIDFPQHGDASSALVDMYLTGKFGTADSVDPKAASIFFACDRYSASFGMRKNLEKGVWVISDRYIGSNIGHQGGKFRSKKQRKEFIRWIFNLEYGTFSLPNADFNFYLKTPAKASGQRTLHLTDEEKIARKKAYLGETKQDIHESDLKHLENAREAYIDAVELFPKEFTVIECMNGDKMLSPEAIHDKIWEHIKNKFHL
jgi:thymidylate kinase